MHCRSCGNLVNDSDLFCNKCGQGIFHPTNPTVQAVPTAPSVPPRQAIINPPHMSPTPAQYVSITSNKNRKTAIMLCTTGLLINLFVGLIMQVSDFHVPLLFFGGLHRFYVGKIWSGLFYTFTAGWVFIGSALDLIQLLLGQFSDNVGQPLRK